MTVTRTPMAAGDAGATPNHSTVVRPERTAVEWGGSVESGDRVRLIRLGRHEIPTRPAGAVAVAVATAYPVIATRAGRET